MQYIHLINKPVHGVFDAESKDNQLFFNLSIATVFVFDLIISRGSIGGQLTLYHKITIKVRRHLGNI